MSKVHSGYLLLLTLVFSTAQAPTFELWSNLPSANDLQAAALGSGRAAPFNLGEPTAAVQHEYAEDGDIKRFQLDELYLPKLDVSLPELFDWSAIEQAYLADADIPADVFDFALDSTHAAAFRVAALDSAYLGGVGRLAGGVGAGVDAGAGAGAPIGSTGPGDGALGSDSNGQSGKGGASGSDGTQTLPGDSNFDDTQLADNASPIGDSPNITDPIQDPKPVPVPAPGALGLVALGLAGLRLAGRNKNRSG